MSDLNRWDYDTYSGYVEWYEDPQGGFVLYDEVKAELDELQNRPTCEEVEALRNEVERLEARLKPLLKFEHAKLVSVKNGENT